LRYPIRDPFAKIPMELLDSGCTQQANLGLDSAARYAANFPEE
jgi:hypothetical protein